MRKLLWIGDAACDSGFSKCTHNTLEGLRATWDVAVLGLNYRGDPHDYPYRIYPAFVPGGDLFGTRRIIDVVSKERPDVVVIQNDPWNIPAYVEQLDKFKKRPLLVGAIAIDGKNCRGKSLNGLDHVVFWTQFAQDEAARGGYTGSSDIIPLGVDLNLFRPGGRDFARKMLQLPDFTLDGFFVLNINRNQPRKRLDLTLEYFAEFAEDTPDAFLYMHVCPTGEMTGFDVDQLAGYYGLHKRVILAEPGVYQGSAEEDLVLTYQAADVQVSTTQGEGWGLTTMEGMACGIPQVVPEWAALGEWAARGAWMVPCTTRAVTPTRINVIGGLPDRQEFVHALRTLYAQRDARERAIRMGHEVVNDPKFRWENIRTRWEEALDRVYARGLASV